MLDKLPENYIAHEVNCTNKIILAFHCVSESSVLCQWRKKSGPLFIEDFVAYKLVLEYKGWKFLFFFFFFFSFQVKARLQKMGALSPMNIFLRQEIDRMQRVITAVRQTLTDLKLAIDGTIIMSEVRILLFWLFGSFVKFYLSLKNQRIIKWLCGLLSPILGLQKTELIKCFGLFLCLFYLPSCRWSGEVPIASLSNNEHDDIENVTKRNYSASILSRAICQMQVSFPGDEFLSTGLKREGPFVVVCWRPR